MNDNGSEQHDERLSEELVAYLDGELSANESDAVEARIRQDDRARSELQKFDRVWNALDDLERATVDDSFTRTTIEMAAVEAKQELARETAMLPVRKRNRWIQVATLATLAVLVGFAALAAMLPNRNRQLYANLPVIMELDAYSEVRDIEFLRLLDDKASDWLLAEWGGEVGPRSGALAELTSASYAARRAYVAGLDDDARADLASKHRRYQSLTPELREELTEWHTRLATDPDAGELQEMMLAYYAWVSQADEVDQARLRSLDAQARLGRVEEMQRWAERRSEMQLSPANAAALRKAVEAMASDRQMQELHAKMVRSIPDLKHVDRPEGPRGYRLEGLRALKESSPRMAMVMIEFASGFADEKPPFPMFVEYRDAIEQQLIAALDDQTAARLRSLDQRDRSRRLFVWLKMAGQRPKSPDVATLEKYFVSGSLSAEDQQRLLAMPKDKMLEELEHLYIREYFGDSDGQREFDRMMEDLGGRGRYGRGRRWGNRDGREGRGDRDGRDERGPRGPGGPRGEGPPPPPPGEGPPI